MDQKPYDTTPMAYPTYDYGFTELQSTTTLTSNTIPIQEANASCSTPTTAYMASSTSAAPINHAITNSVPRNIFNAVRIANGSTVRKVYLSNTRLTPINNKLRVCVSKNFKVQPKAKALPINTEKKRKRILDMLEDGTPIIYEVVL